MRALLSLLFAAGLLPASSISIISTVDSLGGASTVAFRISDTGVITGYAQVPTGDTHAFSVTGGILSDWNGAGSESGAYGVNNTGQIVGVSYVNGQAHGTVWSSQGTTDFGAGSYATAINASGDVAGSSNGKAFVDQNGVITRLGTLPGGNWSAAYGVNSAGAVAGDGTLSSGAFEAFVWTAAAGLTPLGTLGGNSSYATAINDLGQIAGHSSVASGFEHAFVDTDGVLHDLGTLGGGNSYAYDINNAGAAVGYSYLAGNTETHAFASVDGRMIDLNSLLPLGSGWVLEAAYGINNQGDIVGTGTFDGHQTAFLLDPPQFGVIAIPEPSTLVLLVTGLSALATWRRRRN